MAYCFSEYAKGDEIINPRNFNLRLNMNSSLRTTLNLQNWPRYQLAYHKIKTIKQIKIQIKWWIAFCIYSRKTLEQCKISWFKNGTQPTQIQIRIHGNSETYLRICVGVNSQKVRIQN